jgi:hypothetical protein
LSLSNLWVTKAPSGRLPTMSVNVPPLSIQNCHLLSLAIDFTHFSIGFVLACSKMPWIDKRLIELDSHGVNPSLP